VLTMISRVRGVIAACTLPQSAAKLAESSATCTAVAPASSMAGS
jgi:hypothetical protein